MGTVHVNIMYWLIITIYNLHSTVETLTSTSTHVERYHVS